MTVGNVIAKASAVRSRRIAPAVVIRTLLARVHRLSNDFRTAGQGRSLCPLPAADTLRRTKTDARGPRHAPARLALPAARLRRGPSPAGQGGPPGRQLPPHPRPDARLHARPAVAPAADARRQGGPLPPLRPAQPQAKPLRV